MSINVAYSQFFSLPLPYYTGFDSPVEKSGWMQYRKGVQCMAQWSDNTALYHGYNVGGAPTDTVIDWYVSPSFYFSKSENHYYTRISLKIMTDGFSTPFPDNCEIWFGTKDQDPSVGEFRLIGNLSYVAPQWQWIDTTMNFHFIADSGYIAFRYKTIGPEWMDYTIDSINISQGPVSSVEEKNTLKKVGIKLLPNAFNFSTMIQFEHPVINGVLHIYNISGQIVRTISNISGQEYQLLRDELPKGLYFIQLVQGKINIATEFFEITD